MKYTRRLLLAAALAACGATAASAEEAAPLGVVNLNSSASAEVANDLMTLTLSTSRDGPDANAVQAALKRALDAALVEARKAVKPGQLDVRTGNFSLFPRYSTKGAVSGWQGAAELVIEGRDMPAIGQLAGRITTMTVSRVNHGLSREAREKVEEELAAQAIGRYRAKATAFAKQFGYSGYELREVNVSGNEPPPDGPIPMLRSRTMAAQEDAALPVEAGKAVVTVTVMGTVQLK